MIAMWIITGRLFLCFIWFGKYGKKQLEELNKIKQERKKYSEEIQILTGKINEALIEKNRIELDIEFLNKESKISKTNYENATSLMNEQLSHSAEIARFKYLEAEKDFQNHYSILREETVKEYTHKIKEMEESFVSMTKALEDLSSKQKAAIEAAKREQEIKDSQNFFKICLSEEDIEEIKKLREVSKYLRNTEPLNKVIYKVYYEKPTTDMIGRVLGKTVKTGIYKITNLENQMCYVGQAIDAASRWKQHIKRGIGAETPTRNKLYPAMLEYGVENFSFELIEECPKEKLNEREQYWQEYFGAKEFGYSIK